MRRSARIGKYTLSQLMVPAREALALIQLSGGEGLY
ncbi:hypothetical protein M728_005392 (plasmid) [Ensifer sp. WSM1721]